MAFKKKQKIQRKFKTKNIFILVVLFSFIILSLNYSVNAVTLSNVDLYSTGLNLTINITVSKYTDEVSITNTYISFINLRDSETQEEKLTYNITELNRQYFGSDLPYFNSSTDTIKLIKSNLNNDLNSSVTITVLDCNNIGTITTSNNQKYSIPTCSGTKSLTLPNLLLKNGDNIITINYDRASIDTCNNFFSTGNAFVDFTIIFIIVGIAGFIMFMFLGGSSEGQDLDMVLMAGIVIVALVVMSIGMIIINAIGGC